ncbi:aminopeptidase Ey [Drosophila biarmipes]|uniref:aminopeptidase Ey n=1 Tax=Drosophila biarmipes TaxID=125945 RepID=UPI0007E83BDE|nr:aminopeptidase Ey [Drosophila biarmipes]
MKWFLLFVAALGLGLASADSDSSYNYYRLPTSLRPQKYHLRILTVLENPEDLRFSGSVKILIEALENTRNITLHSKNLTIDESQITLRQIGGEAKKDNCVSSTLVNPTHDFYILNTCQELLAGNVYELYMPFSADLNRQLEGYYRSSYKDPVANVTKWISVTQFEPASARLAFPCFDEPDFKAPFVVTLGYHKKYTGLSNMPVKETKPHETLADYIWCEFQESVPMSTYLIAYSVNDFSHKPSTLPNSALFRTWARPNAIDQCDYAAEFGPKVLQYYEQFFGIKFPLPKIDQIAVPDFSAGAMENWGLVTYREIALLYSAAHSSLADKQRVASVVAHELAHQWFGNLVTMKWWTDLWLNEGFATYVASLGVENINPEWRSMEQESLSNLLTIFRRDALESSHPISRPIQMVSEISESFDQISYQKGSTVLRMMHLFLGEESFRSGLQSYLQQYSYKNAEQDNLWASLTQAAHKYRALPKSYDIKSIMDSWTLQTGYPVINVTRDYSAKTAKLNQERYLLNTQISRAHRGGCWWVPLSYTTQSVQDFNNTAPKAWMECGKNGESLPKTIKDLPGADQWVIFNTQLSTLYKVNYDAHNWKLLIETLTNGDFERIHVINRAQLIDDALYLAWTGEQDYEIAMRLIEYLQREREYLPWKSAFENLKRVGRIVRQTPDFEFFKRYMKKLISPIYEHLNGINDTFSSIQQQDQVLLKTMVVNWACQYQVADCVPQSLAYYRNWRSEPNPDEKNPVPINVRSTVYCTSIRHGSDADWEFLWMRYKKSNVAAEKRTILTALGCSREVWLLQRYLELTFDPKEAIRKQDSMWAFQAVAFNEVGFLLAKKYFMDNVDFIYKFYHPLTKDMSRLLSPLSEQVITLSDFNEFKDFVNNSRQSLKGLEQAIQQTLEIMLTNVQWKERNYHQMSRSIQQLL